MTGCRLYDPQLPLSANSNVNHMTRVSQKNQWHCKGSSIPYAPRQLTYPIMQRQYIQTPLYCSIRSRSMDLTTLHSHILMAAGILITFPEKLFKFQSYSYRMIFFLEYIIFLLEKNFLFQVTLPTRCTLRGATPPSCCSRGGSGWSRTTPPIPILTSQVAHTICHNIQKSMKFRDISHEISPKKNKNKNIGRPN